MSPLVGGHIVNVSAAKKEVAPLNGIKARYHAQQGSLSAAGGTQKGEKFPLSYVEGNTAEGGKIAIALHCVPDNYFVAHYYVLQILSLIKLKRTPCGRFFQS